MSALGVSLPTLLMSGRADAFRIQGIGKRWGGLWVFCWTDFKS
jgi:hypothetical protein